MKSNSNVDIKFYAEKVLEFLGNSLSKYTDRIAGAESGSSGGGQGQGSRSGRDRCGTGKQSRGGHRGGR